jgi:hypothetical protein
VFFSLVPSKVLSMLEWTLAVMLTTALITYLTHHLQGEDLRQTDREGRRLHE